MLEITTVVETVRPLFPHGVAVLQEMASQGIAAVGILGGILHRSIVTPTWLASTMLEESQHPEHRIAMIEEFEATFREVALALGAVAPK